MIEYPIRTELARFPSFAYRYLVNDVWFDFTFHHRREQDARTEIWATDLSEFRGSWMNLQGTTKSVEWQQTRQML